MAKAPPQGHAFVSCHVERPLDDEVWRQFSTLQAHRPAGFRIAALIRPPHPEAGEDETLWLARARMAATQGPLGHHTHWTAPDFARPSAGDPAARVLAEGRRLRALGLVPTAFCGGGWYTDQRVAEACADLGYVDCTPRTGRPAYLPDSSPWAELERPAWVRLPSGQNLLSIPTTHSVGQLARLLLARRPLTTVVHLYFHDTDLLSRRRRVLLSLVLALLDDRFRPSDLDTLAASSRDSVPEVAWVDVARL